MAQGHNTEYDLGVIRQLLLAAFKPETLRRFCQDRATFRPIVDTFGPGHGLDDMVDRVIDYCDNHLLFPDLLAELRLQFPQHSDAPVDPAERWTETLKTYKQRMAERYGMTQIFGQPRPVPLDQVFTDVYILEKPAAFRRFDLHQLKQDPDLIRGAERVPGGSLVTRPEAHRLFILGRPGAGKTTFLKYLILEATAGNLDRVPVFVTLKEWADTTQALVPFIVQQFEICGFPDAGVFVEHVLNNTDSAFILFDGLDEVPREGGAHGRATAALKGFAEAHPRAQCLVTCRTAASDFTFDRFSYVEVADFTLEQIETLVHKWFHAEPDKGEMFLLEIKKTQNRGLLELARIPLLLAMLCLAFNETLRFPIRRVEIYQDALDALLRKWDSSRSIRRDEVYRALGLGRKQQLFARIAVQSFEQAEYFLSQSKLEAQIQDYLERLPRADLSDHAEISGRQVLRSIEAQHGILVERAHRIYSFAHLSFQEYYTARYVVENASRGTFCQLLSHCADPRWREVILLVASLLDNADRFFVEFRQALDTLMLHSERVVAISRWAAKRGTLTGHGCSEAQVRGGYWLLLLNRDLALTTARAHTLVSDLNHALNRAYNPARNFANALDQAHVNAHDLARALDLARVLDLACVLDLAHVVDLAHVIELDQSLADILDLSSYFAWDVTTHVARARRRAGTLDLARNLALDHSSARVRELWKLMVRASLKIWETMVDISQTVSDRDLAADLRALKSLREMDDFHVNLCAVVNNHCDYDYEPDWDREEARLLNDYLVANRLLLECLDLAYVSNRQAIKDSLLLPPGMWQPEDWR